MICMVWREGHKVKRIWLQTNINTDLKSNTVKVAILTPTKDNKTGRFLMVYKKNIWHANNCNQSLNETHFLRCHGYDVRYALWRHNWWRAYIVCYPTRGRRARLWPPPESTTWPNPPTKFGPSQYSCIRTQLPTNNNRVYACAKKKNHVMTYM